MAFWNAMKGAFGRGSSQAPMGGFGGMMGGRPVPSTQIEPFQPSAPSPMQPMQPRGFQPEMQAMNPRGSGGDLQSVLMERALTGMSRPGGGFAQPPTPMPQEVGSMMGGMRQPTPMRRNPFGSEAPVLKAGQ